MQPMEKLFLDDSDQYTVPLSNHDASTVRGEANHILPRYLTGLQHTIHCIQQRLSSCDVAHRCIQKTGDFPQLLISGSTHNSLLSKLSLPLSHRIVNGCSRQAHWQLMNSAAVLVRAHVNSTAILLSENITEHRLLKWSAIAKGKLYSVTNLVKYSSVQVTRSPSV